MNKKVRSNIALLLGVTLLVALLGFGAYRTATSDIFDTTGGYVKDRASKGDLAAFMRSCENVNYNNLVVNYKDYLGKPLKYWAIIGDKSDNFGSGVEYIISIPMEDKETKAVRVKPLFEEEFYRGDHVLVYGTLIGLVKFKDSGNIPYIEARKFVQSD